MILTDSSHKTPPFKYDWNSWENEYESHFERLAAAEATEFDADQALREVGAEMYRLERYNSLHDELRDQISVVHVLINDADPNKPPWTSRDGMYIRYWSEELERNLTYQEMARQIIRALLANWHTLNELRERINECWPYRYLVDDARSYIGDYPIPDETFAEGTELRKTMELYERTAVTVNSRWERLSHDMARFSLLLFTLADEGKILS